MKLNLYISVIRSSEVVHIINGEKTIFFGTILNAYSEVPEDYLSNADVIDVFHGFGGLVIETTI
jgi:uncharacterized membrane protein YobD (UPF0266 family)